MILGIIFSLICIAIITFLSWLTFSISPWFILLFACMFPLFYTLCFGVYIIFLFLFTLPINKKKPVKKPSKFFYSLLKQSIHQLLLFTNCKINFINAELLPKNQRFVIVANHISNFDPIVLIELLKKRTIFITKPENENIPICGQLIHKSGFIAMNRNSPFKAVESINLAVKYILDDESDIMIFPEGTRNKKIEDGLLPFHPGSFKIGVKADVPLVVMSIKNTNLLHKNAPFKRTHINVEVVGIIDKEMYQNNNTIQLAELAEKMISDSLKRSTK